MPHNEDEESPLEAFGRAVNRLLPFGPGRSVELAKLDDKTQRRIILHAAKQISEDQLKSLRSEQPNLKELNSTISQNFWMCFITGFCMLFPWFFLPFVTIPLIRVRNLARKNAHRWQQEADPECAHLVLAGDIRRLLKKLPRAHRREAKAVGRELDKMSAQWEDLQKRLERLQVAGMSQGHHELQDSAANLSVRIATETDPIVLASLQRRMEDVKGRRGALEGLATWEARLKAAQDECNESLLHLRDRLTLLGATGSIEDAAAVTVTSGALQSISARLAAAQDASEEVLRLSV